MTEPNEILVIYHADCLDGYGAAWSAYCKLHNQPRYVAARHGEAMPDFSPGAIIYILDFCYAPQVLQQASEKAGEIILIDHHVTAMDQFADYFKNNSLPSNLSVNFDMTRSGCVLTWQHFFNDVKPPKILLHIQDRDLWQFKLDGTREITLALYEKMPLDFAVFGSLDLTELLNHGRILLEQFMSMVNRLAKSAHSVTVSGKPGLAVNAPSFFSSELGQLLATKSGTFGLIYSFDGNKQKWSYSLRSIGDYNVGDMAKTFGGGGHKNAAGFSLENNPFIN